MMMMMSGGFGPAYHDGRVHTGRVLGCRALLVAFASAWPRVAHMSWLLSKATLCRPSRVVGLA